MRPCRSTAKGRKTKPETDSGAETGHGKDYFFDPEEPILINITAIPIPPQKKGCDMFGLFKKKMSESGAAIVFCVRMNHWAAENDDKIKRDFQDIFKDVISIDDFAPHSDGLFHATVAQCSQALFNLFPLAQAVRLRSKVYDTMHIMGNDELFEMFMRAKDDPDRHLLQNDPSNVLHAIPVRLLEYWLGDKLKRLYVKVGGFESLSPLEVTFISSAMTPTFMFWKNFQSQYKIIQTDEQVADLMRH